MQIEPAHAGEEAEKLARLVKMWRSRMRDAEFAVRRRESGGRNPQSYTGRLREAVAQWRDLSHEGSRSLSYRRGPGFVIVEDQRPGFEPATYEFDGSDAKIYLGCDAGATVNGLLSQLIASGGELFSTDGGTADRVLKFSPGLECVMHSGGRES